MEQITIPKGAWAAIVRLLRGNNLGLTVGEAAVLEHMLSSAQVSEVKIEDVPEPEAVNDTATAP